MQEALRAVFVAVLAALALSATAAGARVPTKAERAAIARVEVRELRLGRLPAGCYAIVVAVSAVNSGFARADVHYKPTATCSRLAGNGFDVLRRSRGWQVVWSGDGSSFPKCSSAVIPAPVARELIGGCKR